MDLKLLELRLQRPGAASEASSASSQCSSRHEEMCRGVITLSANPKKSLEIKKIKKQPSVTLDFISAGSSGSTDVCASGPASR